MLPEEGHKGKSWDRVRGLWRQEEPVLRSSTDICQLECWQQQLMYGPGGLSLVLWRVPLHWRCGSALTTRSETCRVSHGDA